MNLQHVVRPPRSAGPAPHPTLLLLHGLGADENDLIELAGELDPGLFVVSARAPFRYVIGYAWYSLESIGEVEPKTFATGFARLSQFVDALPAAYPVDPRRFFTLGFSQGAVMASALLLTRPSVVAGSILLSGYLPDNLRLNVDAAGLVGRPVFLGHGAQDPLISVDLARKMRDYLVRAGVDLTYREYAIVHTIGPEELSDLAAWLGNRMH